MRAITHERYGPPDEVLRLKEIPKPVPRDGEVLVRVHAAPIGGDDWHLMRGMPYVARLVTGLRRPRNPVAGLEVAGRVEVVGANVREFQPGDEVFGWCGGSFAEYVAVPEGQLLPKPVNLSLEQAAAVPISSFTALQGLRDGGIGPGQRVLVNGASGGVGTFAVQIARSYGAAVTGVCGPAKADLVRSLGAEDVVDYTRERFADRGERYDLILDVQGSPSLAECRRALKPRGTLVIVGGTGGPWFWGTDRWFRAFALSPFVGQSLRVRVHTDDRADLLFMKDLIEAGKVTPVVDRTYPLERVTEAIRYVQEGNARGKVVITVP
ncbi:NAD(P)-dependent alcohol dehydrogenase [Streptosporangium algeriense]|uniref:NAD(P)-dependent alcohol dehydrogenase n=1 Tax=Streptosporangium algeriense TaxID=1682748 RepID=A0ABW3DR04_9ACTN